MRRTASRSAAQAAALVSPIPEIVPEFARGKTETVTWGANVDAFSPDRRKGDVRRALGHSRRARSPSSSRAASGPGTGSHVLEAAARRLRDRADLFFLLVGGPDARAGRRDTAAGAWARVPTRRCPRSSPPATSASRPTTPRACASSRLGFYWSPLKIFEYMASGLPTVTIPRPPLTEIVRDGQEGLHAREGDPGGPGRGHRAASPATPRCGSAGARARAARVVERYSWARHCEQLERVLLRIAA